MNKFTFCILLYGDHVEYAKRCLTPLLQLADIELRIAANEVGEETKEYLQTITQSNVRKYEFNKNIFKYPAMRQMFYDPPIESKYICWFDDDSFLVDNVPSWLNDLEVEMLLTDVVGQLMQIYLTPAQRIWVSLQPWYAGKYPDKPIIFPVGGWWCIHADIIKSLDWPPTNIVHRGGDYMLGCALNQHNCTMRNWRDNVIINSSFENKDGSAERRGPKQVQCGKDYEPPLTVLLHDATRTVPLKLLDRAGI